MGGKRLRWLGVYVCGASDVVTLQFVNLLSTVSTDGQVISLSE